MFIYFSKNMETNLEKKNIGGFLAGGGVGGGGANVII